MGISRGFQGDLPGISGKWWVFGTVPADVSSIPGGSHHGRGV